MSNGYIRAAERNRITPAELQLLEMLCRGYELKESAPRLGKSWRTLQCQMKSLMRITRCKTRVQLGIWAVINGYYMPPNGHARADAVAQAATEAGL